MPKAKTYYNLFVKRPGEDWTHEFGDWERVVVKVEEDDMKESGSWEDGTLTKIVTSDGSQADMFAKLGELNAKNERSELAEMLKDATVKIELTADQHDKLISMVMTAVKVSGPDERKELNALMKALASPEIVS